MSANVGEDLKPIQRIASGGELSRIMLALKNVLAENEEVATLIFDEVDTGVSGRAAQKVAEKMADVAGHKQVLCVTHLPQIAAMADTHFSVVKGEREGSNLYRGRASVPPPAGRRAGPADRWRAYHPRHFGRCRGTFVRRGVVQAEKTGRTAVPVRRRNKAPSSRCVSDKTDGSAL